LNQFDLTIVGAGPTGTLAALSATKSLHPKTICLLDQRKTIGKPDHCAGLLSITGLKRLGLENLPSEVIQNSSVYGAKFYSPSGRSFSVKRPTPQALVVNRALFDQHLLKLVQKKGCNIRLNQQVKNIHFQKRKQKLHLYALSRDCLPQKKIIHYKSKIAIIAEGQQGRLSHSLGFESVSSKNKLPATQVIVEGIKDLDQSKVEVFLSNKIAPGFFAWIIPLSDTSAKVGLASQKGNAWKRLQYFLRKYSLTKKRFSKGIIKKRFGGVVIIDGPIKRTSTTGLLVVGDAAGQTKATTGGGVITGGIASIIAGEVASSGVKANDNSREFLKKYDQSWKQQLSKQLQSMVLLRKLVNRLSDKSLDKSFETIIKNNLDRIISEKGDIDNQAEIIFNLLSNPSVISLGFKIIPDLFLKS
jgi:geranylgeranyl reductase family protein